MWRPPWTCRKTSLYSASACWPPRCVCSGRCSPPAPRPSRIPSPTPPSVGSTATGPRHLRAPSIGDDELPGPRLRPPRPRPSCRLPCAPLPPPPPPSPPLSPPPPPPCAASLAANTTPPLPLRTKRRGPTTVPSPTLPPDRASASLRSHRQAMHATRCVHRPLPLPPATQRDAAGPSLASRRCDGGSTPKNLPPLPSRRPLSPRAPSVAAQARPPLHDKSLRRPARQPCARVVIRVPPPLHHLLPREVREAGNVRAGALQPPTAPRHFALLRARRQPLAFRFSLARQRPSLHLMRTQMR